MYIFTLDSHDWFGPFPSHAIACWWAEATNHRSYRIVNEPLFGISEKVNKPYVPYDAPAPYGL